MKPLAQAMEIITDPGLKAYVENKVIDAEILVDALEDRIYTLHMAIADGTFDPYHLGDYIDAVINELESATAICDQAALTYGEAITEEQTS